MKTLVDRLLSFWVWSQEITDSECVKEGAARIKQLEADLRISDRNAYYAAVDKAGKGGCNDNTQDLIDRLRDAAGTDDNFLLYDSAAQMQLLLEENKNLLKEGLTAALEDIARKAFGEE